MDYDECLTVVADGERAVKPLVHLDAGAGVADAVGARGDLQPFAIERDRVVVIDGPLVLEGEDYFALEAWGPRPIG